VHYNLQYPSPAGKQGDPLGVCTDCRSLACTYHGHRRISGGFICIQCDQNAIVGSGAVKSTASNRLRTQLITETGADRPNAAEWLYPNVQEWALAFVDPATGELPEQVAVLYAQIGELVLQVDRTLDQLHLVQTHLRRLYDRRQTVRDLADPWQPAASLFDQAQRLWFETDERGRELMALGLLLVRQAPNPYQLPPGIHVLAVAAGMITEPPEWHGPTL
jgi:hypothetical protein